MQTKVMPERKKELNPIKSDVLVHEDTLYNIYIYIQSIINRYVHTCLPTYKRNVRDFMVMCHGL